MHKKYLFLCLVALFIACLALTRLLPHPNNFTPILAAALLAGSFLKSKMLKLGLPISAMLLSDAILGFHAVMPVIYATLCVIALLAVRSNGRANFTNLLGSALMASILFFVTTNFAVWATSTLYPHTAVGLLNCYLAAIPFFHNTTMSTVLYFIPSFYALKWAQHKLADTNQMAFVSA